MPRIDAHSIGAPLARQLGTRPAARVTARFDSTLTLVSGDGTLWAITTEPNEGALRIVAPILPTWQKGIGIETGDEGIFADGIELSFHECAYFNPVPRQRALTPPQRARAARTMADILAQQPLPEALGFWDELAGVVTSVSSPLPCQGEGRSESLLRFIGRGPGLTPAGDDFLQALLVTLHSGDESDQSAFESVAHSILPMLSRTTRTSRAFLEEATRGWAFGALKNVLDALPAVTQGKIDALLSIGGTSGPAYAFGVLLGIVNNGIGDE